MFLFLGIMVQSRTAKKPHLIGYNTGAAKETPEQTNKTCSCYQYTNKISFEFRMISLNSEDSAKEQEVHPIHKKPKMGAVFKNCYRPAGPLIKREALASEREARVRWNKITK